jgi:hypothetical protein
MIVERFSIYFFPKYACFVVVLLAMKTPLGYVASAKTI